MYCGGRDLILVLRRHYGREREKENQHPHGVQRISPRRLMDYEVQLRQSPPQWLAAGVGRANRSNLPKQVTTLGTPAWDYVKKNGIGNDGHHVALYYENGDGPCALPTPEGVVIAVGPRVHQPFENQPPVQCVELPAGTVAWTRHRGS